MTEPDWRALNRAHWDERVAVHLGPRGYTLNDLRAGRVVLNAIEEAELGPVAGLHILHLQCHFGRDTIGLVQRGATAVGLDFSAPAIDAAGALATEMGLQDRARFMQSDLYDARAAIAPLEKFDLVYVTWGAITWLPDIAEWARIVAHFLKHLLRNAADPPSGSLAHRPDVANRSVQRCRILRKVISLSIAFLIAPQKRMIYVNKPP